MIDLTPEQEIQLDALARQTGVSLEETLKVILSALTSEIGAPSSKAELSIFENLSRVMSRMSSRDSLPIRSTPDVMGGDACIRSTRIPVWTLVAYKRDGLTDAQLLEAFPSLNVADLTAAWDYNAAHGDAVEAERRRHEDID